MEQSTLALIIVLCTCVLYILEIFPVAVTTLLGMLAMVYAGILTSAEAFSGFSSTPVMLVIGMVIIIDALLNCGVAGKIGKFLSKFAGKNEKLFVVIVFLLAAFLSMFMTNASLVAMFMPFIASVAATSNGTITKKNTYLTLATGGLIGGTATLAGSTAPLLANDVLKSVGAESMEFFEPLPIALSIIVVMSACYWLFLYKLQAKCFDFEEINDGTEKNIKEVPINKKNAVISVSVFLSCAVLFVAQPFGWDLGLIAISGALILIITKCVDGKTALKNMFWSALITLAAAIGIAKGFVNSGVGEKVIAWLIELLGEGVANPLVLVTVFLLSGYVLSLFMSNGSLVAMLASIAVPMAVEIGCNPMPMAMACVFGASLAMATPAATTSVTMVQVAGYRFKDYLRIGGLTGIIGLITAWLAIVLFYGLL
ncbi:MAG: SLC13/DASS family transporter [Clostridia bacterium]|nr:SLC13/DASS family transporter [Clostridia bacterium]